MKYLLIFSIILVTVSVFGSNNKGEVLFQWGEYPNYKWMEFGDSDTQPKYKGQVKDGKPNGQGTYTWGRASEFVGDTYVGEWKNGKMEKLRIANEKLRDSGKYWHDACKDTIRDLLGKAKRVPRHGPP